MASIKLHKQKKLPQTIPQTKYILRGKFPLLFQKQNSVMPVCRDQLTDLQKTVEFASKEVIYIKLFCKIFIDAISISVE